MNPEPKTAASLTRTFITTYLTVQTVGVCGGSACIALYAHPAGTPSISDAPTVVMGLVGLVIFGALATFIPALLYVAALIPVTRHALSHQWPAWARYAISVGIMACLFFVFVSFTARPIPDLATRFQPEAPLVQRPALSLSEIPLLITALLAGVLGTRTCNRILQEKNLRREPLATSFALALLTAISSGCTSDRLSSPPASEINASIWPAIKRAAEAKRYSEAARLAVQELSGDYPDRKYALWKWWETMFGERSDYLTMSKDFGNSLFALYDQSPAETRHLIADIFNRPHFDTSRPAVDLRADIESPKR